MLNMNCILCNDILGECSQLEIYITFTTHSNTLLVSFIKRILNCDLNQTHSRYICKECYNIFEELDFSELACTRLRKQIFQRWILSDCESLTKDVSSQTDNLESDEEEKSFTEFTDVLPFETIKTESDELHDNTDEVNTESSNRRSKVREKKIKPYECKVCQKRFASKHGMSLHTQRKHPNVKPTSENIPNIPSPNEVKLECEAALEDCSKSEPEYSEFQMKDDIDRDIDETSDSSKTTNCHTKRRTKKKFTTSLIKPLKYSCPQCPKMWRTMGELRSHVASHSSLRPFICEVCGQAYKHKSALDIHVGMHNGINPFSCNYCHKSFTQKGALQRHLPIHTGEAPYQCDLCGKCFVHHTSFNMHTLAHTGQKSYKCSICGLALLSGSHLKRHMRVHTGERPYACANCGKRFAERYNLAAHQRLHEAGPSELSKRLHRCQVCGAGFDRRPKLEEHLSNNHNKIQENDQSRKWVGLGHFLTNMISHDGNIEVRDRDSNTELVEPQINALPPALPRPTF